VTTHITSQTTIAKFGGTSIKDRNAFERVAEIIAAKRDNALIVVVSAMSGVTDALIASFQSASNRCSGGSIATLDEHFERHREVGQSLSAARFERLKEWIETSRSEIAQLLDRAAFNPTPNLQIYDAVASHGEQLAANLLTLVLEEHGLAAEYVDARRVVITSDNHTDAEPLFAKLKQRAIAELLPLLAKGRIPVLGGFIGATIDGVTTTMGRGSSDFSATLIGAALHAREIEIWTDVDGVQTADPRLVQSTRTVPHISYGEAMQLAQLGARVMHARMIEPVVADRIPIRILNSYAPQQPGTLISAEPSNSNAAVKAIAHKIAGESAIVGCVGHGLKINFRVEPDAVAGFVRQLHAAIFE
jgi:aspartate kinase